MSQWIYCPICSNKTRLKIREDTELKNFPLFSLKCKQETLIDVKQLLALYIGVRHSNNLVAAISNPSMKKAATIIGNSFH